MIQAFEYGNENPEKSLEIAADLTGISLDTLEEGATTYWPTEVRYEDLDRANTKMADLGYLTDKAPFEERHILRATE